MREHTLKCWPDSFRGIWDGTKTFELRLDDRGYGVGDVLVLREFNKAENWYTGREVRATVTYMITERHMPWGAEALREGWVIMGIKVDARLGAALRPRRVKR